MTHNAFDGPARCACNDYPHAGAELCPACFGPAQRPAPPYEPVAIVSITLALIEAAERSERAQRMCDCETSIGRCRFCTDLDAALRAIGAQVLARLK